MDPQERAALLDRARRPGVPRPELEAAVAVLGAGSNRDRVLRRAHAQAWRLKAAGQQVPFWLRVLDSRYHAARRKPRPRPAGLLAQIRSDEQRRGWIQMELALGPLGIVREKDPEPAAREGQSRAA